MLLGHHLNGRYKILETIGGGGMAHVYKANDLILDRMVAVKVLRPELVFDDEFVRRFHREAQSTTSLDHPNIVSVYDVGFDDPYYFIVMEYVKGTTLKQYIQNRGVIPVEEAVDIMKQVASAIEHAHANHIIHRDLKPHNILLDEYGTAKVTDFGIATALTQTTITHTNAVMGSIHYLSPEQARGGVVDKKTDIYSLGIVFFEMVTGRLPFTGDSAVSIVLKHLQEEIPYPTTLNPNIPQSVENIILKAVCKDVNYRYDSVSSLLADLNTALLPERLNEARIEIPNEEEENTAIIPVIKEEEEQEKDDEKNQTESKESQSKQKKKKWWVIGGSFLILFLILLFFIPKLLYVDDVNVPDVTNKDYAEAYEILSNLKLDVEKKELPSNEVEAGKVFKQDPEAGSIVKEKSSILLYVSTGKEKIKMPDYVGKDKEVVAALLKDKGFEKVEWIEEENRDIPENQIIKQHPEKGEKVIPEETTVFMYYSTGAPTILLGNLVGMSVGEAERYLSSNELIVKIEESYSDTVEPGKVIDQSPKSSEEVQKGSEVVITISKGKDPEKQPSNGSQTNGSNDGNKQKDNKINVNQKIEIEVANDNEKHQVQIFYTDILHLKEELFVDEEITETKTYVLPLVVTDKQQATYRVLLDGKEVRNQTVDYEAAKKGL
ncbi:MAG TPA: Stk1 family PASTA domain-containing Ser/Thr kinase [Massilibacterium sp.]|nr:Stk1 family PASTA domain-containing Ser/Thr kinase [Massilibacterium sp.]